MPITNIAEPVADESGKDAIPHEQATTAPKPGEVRTSRGVVTLRTASIGDEERALKFLGELGHDRTNLALSTIFRSTALCTIESIDGAKEPSVDTVDKFAVLQGMFGPADGIRLVNAYVTLNGLDDASFRRAG